MSKFEKLVLGDDCENMTAAIVSSIFIAFFVVFSLMTKLSSVFPLIDTNGYVYTIVCAVFLIAGVFLTSLTIGVTKAAFARIVAFFK